VAGAAARSQADPVATVRVSGPSPFLHCPDRQARVFVNGEVEPALAVDPKRGRLVIVYQQDRFPDGAARGIAAGFSTNGGRTWARSVLPVGLCARARDLQPVRTSDPWVSIGADGRVYALASYAAVASGNGGRSWTAPVALARPSAQFILDKGSLTADPKRAGTAYAVWARFLRPASGAPSESDAMLSRTTNGGVTWSKPQVILEHGSDAGSISSVIVPDPSRNRLFHLAFWEVGPEPTLAHPSRLIVQRSTDGGSTWTEPHTIAMVRTVAGRAKDPTSGRQIRTGFVVPSFALDRRSGALYAVWQDSRFAADQVDQIAVAGSRDGGNTWTAPRRISQPAGQAFVPNIAVTPAGAVGVAYYEAPKSRTKRSAPIQYWLAISRDGGRSFSRRPVGRPFSLRYAPLMDSVPELAVPPGLFLGDYMGLEASAGTFHLAFVAANNSKRNPSDVLYAAVRPGP
jgi:hypothetical protein